MELDNIILKRGGSLTFNPGKDTFCVVTDIVSLYTKSYCTRMQLILASWIHKCVAAQSCLPFQEEDFFFILDFKFLPSTKKSSPRYPFARGIFFFFFITGRNS
ncbi:hypothetical protein GHT06_020140 [Daphnia sinensis]|uniref:BRCT domain-containing protein n=1 Tax=Daphnia sinensis TaxID=1820382 RepID=A0AAD5PRB4_9CRUS|nr:hypothetical protein GHT06_020140 [Daphnia sinensis]